MTASVINDVTSSNSSTTTPSPDETCSSCQEDLLLDNQKILVDKIHQDGERVLKLIDSVTQLNTVKEANRWLEERKWIVNRLKCVVPVCNKDDIKSIIDNLVEKFLTEDESDEREMKKKYEDLEQKLTSMQSKLDEVNLKLIKEKSNNHELKSEVSDLQNQLSEANRLAQLALERESHFIQIKAEVKALKKKFPDEEIRSKIEEFDKKLEELKNLKKEVRRKDLLLNDMTENHKKELACLKKEIDVLKKVNSVPIKETSIQDLVTKIIETTDAFTNNEPNFLNDILYGMLHNFLNFVLRKITEQHDKELAAIQQHFETRWAKLHGLYWRYKKIQDLNTALRKQKKYLLMLLRGFQSTERETCSWINLINNYLPTTDGILDVSTSDVTLTDSPLCPKSRFRAAVFAVIAVERMKIIVRNWRYLALIPSSEAIDFEIQSMFPPATSPGYFASAPQSQSYCGCPSYGSYGGAAPSCCGSQQPNFGLGSSAAPAPAYGAGAPLSAGASAIPPFGLLSQWPPGMAPPPSSYGRPLGADYYPPPSRYGGGLMGYGEPGGRVGFQENNRRSDGYDRGSRGGGGGYGAGEKSKNAVNPDKRAEYMQQLKILRTQLHLDNL